MSNTRNLLYLIGVPGAGKTTLLQHALNGLEPRHHSKPFAHLEYAHAVQLGKSRDSFGGTDALPMNVQPLVARWLASTEHVHVLGEGDRLGNASFFTAVRLMGWALDVCLLDTPPAVAAHRRRQRGSNQNPVWLKGRQSKVAALVPFVTLILDGNLPVDLLARQLRAHPVIQSCYG